MSVSPCAGAELSRSTVWMRARGRRTARTRAVFSSWPLARWKRRLNTSRLRASSSVLSSSGVLVLRSDAFISGLHRLARDELGLDRQLGRGKIECFLGDRRRHAINLEHDAARLHAAHPILGRALAAAHADFGGLGRNRHI